MSEVAVSDSSKQPSMDELYKRVFPLYLAPFEQFLLADDSAKYPMTFVISMIFKGQLLRDEFMQALDQALDRHRILRCSIERAKKGRMCFVYKPDLQPQVEWLTDKDPIPPVDTEKFDYQREAGLRVFVQQGPEEVEVFFNYNHLMTDGIGSHFFMGDLFAIYANLVSGPGTAKLIDLDPSLLKNRAYRQRHVGTASRETASSLQVLFYTLKKSLFTSSRSIKLPGHTKPPGQKLLTPRFGIYAEALEPNEHKQLRDVAVDLGGTVNDILCIELFRLMKKWDIEHGASSYGRPYRILLPTNLRARGDDEMPLTNMTSYYFVSRSFKQISDKLEFAKGIRDETARLKNEELGREFIEACSHAAVTGSWIIPLVVAASPCGAASVLTSVGDPTRRYTSTFPRRKGALIAGNLELVDFTGCPPLRPGTRFSVAITTYRRRLTISLHCDPYHFTPEDAQSMLNSYMDACANGITTAIHDRQLKRLW